MGVFSGQEVRVEQRDLSEVHLPSQQWNSPGAQILTTQSCLLSAQEKSGHRMLFKGQESTVGHI